MSRSRKKVAGGFSNCSEKDDKKIWHGRMRMQELLAIKECFKKPEEDVIFPIINDVSDPWCMRKDGGCASYYSKNEYLLEAHGPPRYCPSWFYEKPKTKKEIEKEWKVTYIGK